MIRGLLQDFATVQREGIQIDLLPGIQIDMKIAKMDRMPNWGHTKHIDTIMMKEGTVLIEGTKEGMAPIEETRNNKQDLIRDRRRVTIENTMRNTTTISTRN